MKTERFFELLQKVWCYFSKDEQNEICNYLVSEKE